MKYCRHCGVPVVEIYRPEGSRAIGRGKVGTHKHDPSVRSTKHCGRVILFEEDLTEEDWWGNGEASS